MEKKAAGGETEICRRTNGIWRCKKAASADNKHHYCDKHYKELEIKRKKSLPQDEQICSRSGSNGRWRCKDFRMNSEIKWCEKHYIQKKNSRKKKTCTGGDCPIQEIRASERGTQEDDLFLDDTSDTIVGPGESAKFGTKRTERSGELKPLTKIREPVVETRALKRRKMVREGDRFDGKGGCGREPVLQTRASKRRKMVTEDADTSHDETRGIQPANGDDTCGGTANFKGKRKIDEKAEGSGKLESLTRTREHSNFSKQRDKVPATTSDTSNCDAIIEGGTANIGRKRKNVERTEGSRDLESLTRARGHLVELDSLEHYKRKCLELSAELEKKNIEHETRKLELEMKKVELEKKDVEHEKMQVEIEMKKVELAKKNIELEKKKVECTNLQGKLAEVETRLIAANGMLEMNNWNKMKIRWKSEDDMLSSFEEDPEFYMKAVCALYRKHIYAPGEESAKGLHFEFDTVRCTTLAMFLMDEDCNGDIKKSLKELETFDSEAVANCKRLAKRYSTHLFDIYQNGDDPFFPSMCNCRPRRSNC